MDATPDHWRRAFACSPEKPHAHTPVDIHQHSHHHPDANEHQLPQNEDDSLPRTVHGSHSHSLSQPWSRSRLRARVSTPTPFSAPFAPTPSSSILVKRRRQNRPSGGRVDNPSSMSPAVHTKTTGTTSRKRKRTMSVQVQSSGDIGEDSMRVDTPERAPPRKRARVVFDAVVIVRKNKRSLAQPEMPVDSDTIHVTSTSPKDSSPRESSELEISASLVAPCDSPVAETRIASDVDSKPPLVQRTSKYFTRAHPERGEPEVLTPPSSLVLTIPVSIESSEFEPMFGEPCHEPHTDETADGGLFDDLMIMLRRLKPILIQESIADEPWKVLIAVRLLNVTTARAAIPVYSKIIDRWPTPRDLANAPHEELVELLRPLGLYNKRAEWLKDMSSRFARDYQAPTSPSINTETCVPMRATRSLGKFVPASPLFYYPGVGKYAHDSLRIFCSSAGLVDEDEWKRVMPEDKELVRYLRWRWAVDEGKIWYPGGVGVVGDIDVSYLVTLVDELAEWFDHTLDATGEVYMYHFYNDLCAALESS